VGNGLILAGVAVAAAGSAASGLGITGTAAFIAIAVVLLYAGFVGPGELRFLRGFGRRGGEIHARPPTRP
jgi:hypothetical protein